MTTCCEKCLPYELTLERSLDPQRTLLINNLHRCVEKRHVENLFSCYGKIDYLRILCDPEGRSKERALLTLASADGIDAIINSIRDFSRNGKELDVKRIWTPPCMCNGIYNIARQTDAQKNLRVIYVRQLCDSITEEQLLREFRVFGPIVDIEMTSDDIGLVATMTYESPGSAATAVACMHGIYIERHHVSASIVLGYDDRECPVELQPGCYTVYGRKNTMTIMDFKKLERYANNRMKKRERNETH